MRAATAECVSSGFRKSGHTNLQLLGQSEHFSVQTSKQPRPQINNTLVTAIDIFLIPTFCEKHRRKNCQHNQLRC